MRHAVDIPLAIIALFVPCFNFDVESLDTNVFFSLPPAPLTLKDITQCKGIFLAFSFILCLSMFEYVCALLVCIHY